MQPQWTLCVSGDRQTAAQLRQLLQKLRFRAESAGGIEEALALTRQFAPAMIVVDFQLADGSGLELIRRLRQERKTARTPVLMLATTIQSEHYRHRLVNPGPQEWLDKPLDDERLATAVMRWFGVEIAPPPAHEEPHEEHPDPGNQGTFSDLPFARVLALAGRRGRGRLHVDRHGQWIDIWFDGKRVVGLATAYLLGSSLGEMLVRRNRLSPHALADAQRDLAAGRRLGDWLLDQSLLTADELEAELQRHVMEKLTIAFSWRWYDGTWRYFVGETKESAQVTCDVDLRQVVFAGIADYYDRDRLEMIFTKRDRLRRALIPTSPYFEELPVAARRLMRAADGRASAVKARLRAGMEVRRFYQVLYALWVLDLVRFGDPVKPEDFIEEIFLDPEESIGPGRR